MDSVTQTGSSLNGVTAPAATGNDLIQGFLGPSLFGGTLNPLDTIAPGGSNNSLTLADNFGGQTIPLGVTISNIQSLTLIEEVNAGTGAGNRFDTTVITTPAGAAVLSQFTATSAGTGTDWYNAGAMTNVTATADAGSVNLTGGANDTVTAVKGITISGAADSVTATNSTSGGVSITGGTNVTVNQGGGGAVTVTGESGTVNVTDTNTGLVTVNNGTAVTVTAQGPISIGATTAPTGAITATINGPADAFEDALPSITAFGGTSATVNTTGSNSVTLGSTVAPVAGPVQITDTNSGPSPDAFTVLATGSVNLTTTPTSGTINIGQDALLNASGTGLKNADQPTGNVVVNNSETFGSKTYYGSGGVNIDTNGATSVSVTGGTGGVNITDLETTKATGGANVGDAIGTSTLSSVSLNGVGGTTITSDALTSLSISNTTATVTVDETPMAPSNTDPALALALTLSNYAGNVTDNTASSVSVSTSGSSADSLFLDASKATTLTFMNSASLALTGGSLGALTSIVADNSGSLALGNVGAFAANLTSINATGSTGPVSVELSEGSGSKISFNGAGGGKDTVTLDSNTIGTGTHVAGSGGSSTLVANYNATTADTPLGTNAAISGFSTLAVGDVNSDAGGPVGNVYAPSHPAMPAVAEVVEFPTSGLLVAGNTVTVIVNGHSTGTITAFAGETDAQMAAVLAGALTSAGTGDLITYTAGQTFFTVTAPVPGVDLGSLVTITSNSATTGSFGFAGTSFVPATFQKATVAVTMAANAFTGNISITVNGNTVGVSTTAGETAQAIANAFVSAINADSFINGTVMASDNGGTSTTITITNDTAGSGSQFTISDSGGGSDPVFPFTSGVVLGGPSNTAGTNSQAQTDTYTVASTFAAGNVINFTFGGFSGSYTVTTGDAASNSTLVTDLAGAINTQLNVDGVHATHGANSVTVTDPSTPTETTGGSFTDSLTVANGGTVSEGFNVIHNNQAATPAGGDAYYDATGFTALTVGQTTGDVTFMNAAAGTPLTITASQGGGGIIEYVLAKTTATSDTLNLTVGVDGSTAGITTEVATALNTAADSTSSETAPTPVIALSIETALNISSVGNGTSHNTLTIDDGAAKSITISGDEGLGLVLHNDTQGVFTSAVTSITSTDSGVVDVNGVNVSANGAIFSNTAAGAGLLRATGEQVSAAGNDTFNIGAGGGDVTVGFGGGITGLNAGASDIGNVLQFGTGSETVNLISGNPVSSDVRSHANDFASVNGWTISPSSATDVLMLPGTHTTLANTGVTAVPSFGTTITDLDYKVVNGIITFVAANPIVHPLSSFSLAQLIGVTAALEGIGQIAAFQYSDGNTYVVENGGTAIWNGANFVADDVGVTVLDGVTGVQGFGSQGAANTIVVKSSTAGDVGVENQVANSANITGNATNAVYDETGFAVYDNTSTQTAGTTSTALNNLEADSSLHLHGVLGNITTTQVGASGTNALSVAVPGANVSMGTLTTSGDWLVELNAFGHSLSISSLVDTTGTLTQVAVSGLAPGGNYTIGGVSGTALTTIDDSAQAGGSFNLTDALNGQTIKLGSVAAGLATDGNGDTISGASATAVTGHANGDGDTLTLGGNVGTGGSHFSASGLADTIITLGNGTDWLDANNNSDSITLGTGANTVSATGVNDTITFGNQGPGSSSVAVGNGANVTFGTTSAAHTETVDLTAVNNTVGAATTSGNFTILNHVVDGPGDLVQFDNNSNFHDNFNQTAIDVAADANLAAALNSAAAVAGTVGAGHAQAEWFQWQGNTYVVDAEAGAHTGLNATDYVVEITGVVDLSHASFNNGHILTL